MLFSGCKTAAPLQTVSQLDVQKYSGTWYEIARITHRFEKGLDQVSATYTLRDDGKITVLNKGRKESNPQVIKTAKGVAWIPDSTKPAQLKVQFFWPFAGNYWIIELDPDYQYALVGDPSRQYLWILSRSKIMDNDLYNKLVSTAKAAGFDTGKLDKITQ